VFYKAILLLLTLKRFEALILCSQSFSAMQFFRIEAHVMVELIH
jgi:hypothetical protein